MEKGDGEVTSIGKLAATASPMTIPTVQRRLIQVSDCKTDCMLSYLVFKPAWHVCYTSSARTTRNLQAERDSKVGLNVACDSKNSELADTSLEIMRTRRG